MTSFAHLKLDFYDDPTVVMGGQDIPASVRKTKLARKEELEKISSENFALVLATPDGALHHKFPTHTHGDTWLSVKAFEKNAHKLPLAMQETAAHYLCKAAKLWTGNLSWIGELTQKVGSQNPSIQTNLVPVTRDMEYLPESIERATREYTEKTASLSDEDFGIVVDGVRRYPLHTPELVKKASDWFDENYMELKPELRRMMACRIIKAASKENLIVTTDEVFKYAGPDRMYSDDLPLSIQLRKHYVVDDTELHLLDDFLDKKASLEPEVAVKLLEKIDERLGLSKYWDTQFPDPYASVYAMPKFADYHYCGPAGEVSGSDLREYVERKNFRECLESYVSKEIIDELERNPVEVFNSLPVPEKELVMGLMKE
jgi:hypothetical protein